MMAFAVAAMLLLLLGFAVREAEANQVGSTDNASLWVFSLSALCLYAAFVTAWAAFRRKQQKRRR